MDVHQLRGNHFKTSFVKNTEGSFWWAISSRFLGGKGPGFSCRLMEGCETQDVRGPAGWKTIFRTFSWLFKFDSNPLSKHCLPECIRASGKHLQGVLWPLVLAQVCRRHNCLRSDVFGLYLLEWQLDASLESQEGNG